MRDHHAARVLVTYCVSPRGVLSAVYKQPCVGIQPLSYTSDPSNAHPQGIAYHVGDYVVRLGSINAKPGDEKKGWMLEVEYLPTQHWATAKQPIQVVV